MAALLPSHEKCEFFPTKGLQYLTEMLLSFISCPGGWSNYNQVKEPDAEVLGWRGYTWHAVVRPVGGTAEFSKMTAAYGRARNIQFSGNSSGETFLHSACQLHAPSKLETSGGIVLCDKTSHFRVAFKLFPVQGV
jgi:hypothetical protein